MNVVDLPEKEVKELRLLDNKIAENNQWDFDLLKVEMLEVGNDMVLSAFADLFDEDFLKSNATVDIVTSEDLIDKKNEMDNMANG